VGTNNDYLTEPCPFCQGIGTILTGKGDTRRCPMCSGSGAILVPNNLRPDISDETSENEDETRQDAS